MLFFILERFMKNCKKPRKKILFSLLLITANFFALYAENFRVAKTHVILIPQNYSEVSANLGIFDALAIKLPEDKTFVTGLELTMKVPQIMTTWRDSVAYTFYDGLSPLPTENTIDYTGSRTSISTISGKIVNTIYIPLNEKFSIKNNPYAKILEEKISAKNGIIFLRYMLAMKGAPEELENARIQITAKPVLSSEGYFSLEVSKPEGKNENFSIYIDDTFIPSIPKKMLLKEGEHHLRVTGETFRNEVRTFIVEQAKITSLKVALRGIEPEVKILSPENASIYFDGEELASPKEPFAVTQGPHTVKFAIGDYEITKTFDAINGRSYSVNLNIDASVTEEE